MTIWDSLAARSEQMAETAMSDVLSLDDWRGIEAQRRREFLRCLGLDPMPEACDPDVREYGEFRGKGFRARKIGFQLLPDCWGSAVIYYPDPLPPQRAPGVLYVCGHADIGTWHYQYCPILWARRGYVCLVVDTIEQNDNPGEHHGLLTERMDSWLAMGYTPAGGETWNSLRALEVLRSDPAADPERIGVTGISGGGAVSFYTAVVDTRIKALSSLCGISTPKDAIANRRMFTHCDCIYPHNLFGRDISEYAALLAPRPALFCFGDHDSLFCPEETSAFVVRTRKIFELHGQPDHCGIVSHPCGHEDHPAFTEATQKWFDRHVAGEERPLLSLGEREFSERTISVFNGVPPKPNHLALLPELISPRGGVSLPYTAEEWPGIRTRTLRALPPLFVEEESSMTRDQIWKQNAAIRSSHSGSIGGVQVWLETVCRGTENKLVLSIAGGGELFQHPLSRVGAAGESVSIAALQPRLSGANFPALGDRAFPSGAAVPGVRQRLMQAMILTGQTPVMMHIFDLRVAIGYLASLDEFKGYALYLHGLGEVGVAALYHSLVDERVAGVIIEDLPESHTERVPLPGILRVLDLPEAVGLMAPRKVALVDPGHHKWTWPKRVYERLGCEQNLVLTASLTDAFRSVLGGDPS